MTHPFPVRYHRFHDDANINFQLNRCLTWAGESLAPELADAAGRITDFLGWKRETLALARRLEGQGRLRESAYCYRAAEFFMNANDSDKRTAYHDFVRIVSSVYPQFAARRIRVSYRDSWLPAWDIPAATERPLGVIVIHGGFDSFIEELYPLFCVISEAGWRLIAFEGPGQGAALWENGLVMTPDWHVPVGAVLDHFGLQEVCLVGMSLGGCLALRAAARESRVRRVIAFDALHDFRECIVGHLGARRRFLEALLALHAGQIVDWVARKAAGKDLLVDWGLRQGLQVMGTESPYLYFQALRQFNTRDVSSLITQDVLVLAGSQDHFVPVRQFHDQLAALVSARSLTARLFTDAEEASAHCQIGNIDLALRTMLAWARERSEM